MTCGIETGTGGSEPVSPLRDRRCGDCALCCKLMAITELSKPAGQWCPHSVERRSCAIYGARPPTCRAWHCGYRLLPFLGEHWHPARCGMVVHWGTQERQLKIVVDQGFEERWQRTPYGADIATLDRWCLASRHSFTIKEARGNWMFDPRGLSDGPLFVMREEDVLGLGSMPLLKLHVSLREACRLARARYIDAHKLLAGDWLAKKGEAGGEDMAMILAVGILYSGGLVLDARNRIIRLAAAEPELAAGARKYLEHHALSPANGLPLLAHRTEKHGTAKARLGPVFG